MSDDSSKAVRWWQLGGEWGIIVSLLTLVLAMQAPLFLVQPVAHIFMPLLPVDPNMKLAIATATITVLSVGIIAAVLAVYGKSFRDIGVKRPTWMHAAKAFLALIVYIAVSLCVQMVARNFFGLNSGEPQELGYSGNPGDIELAVIFIVLVVLRPFAEELIFRGFVLTGLRRRLPFWAAAIAVSALFAWIHGQWNVGLDVFVMSMVSCYLVEKTKSLWPAIFLHMFKNGVAFYLVYLYNGA